MASDPAKNKRPNVFIFIGEDDFSLRQKIQIWKAEFAKKYSGTSIVDLSSDGLAEIDLAKKLDEVLTPSLFSAKKLVVARNCLPTKSSQEILIAALEKTIGNLPVDYFLVFWQDSMDRRLSFIKNLQKQVNVVEFPLPHGRDLNLWIKKQVTIMHVNLSDGAIDQLAVLSGRDLFEEKKAGGRVIERKEAFDLWRIYTELQKLSAAGQVDAVKVTQLVSPVVSENVFALADAVVSQNKKAALEVLENLMSEDNTDEKQVAIKLVGLLAEQIRSLLIVGLLKNQNLDQNQIAEFLGWSPGRVFVTTKNMRNIAQSKLKNLLSRLLAVDLAIKSSDLNPKLLLDLLLAN